MQSSVKSCRFLYRSTCGTSSCCVRPRRARRPPFVCSARHALHTNPTLVRKLHRAEKWQVPQVGGAAQRLGLRRAADRCSTSRRSRRRRRARRCSRSCRRAHVRVLRAAYHHHTPLITVYVSRLGSHADQLLCSSRARRRNLARAAGGQGDRSHIQACDRWPAESLPTPSITP